jgi:hypothetical protein
MSVKVSVPSVQFDCTRRLIYETMYLKKIRIHCLINFQVKNGGWGVGGFTIYMYPLPF